MKTSIKNLFATALTLVVLTSSAFATTNAPVQQVTVLNQVKNINKLVVSGNVEVLLVQSPVESVKVYDSYYSKNALVQQQEGVLRISSYEKETLIVAVYVRDINTIDASGNSNVKTCGKINFLSLDVNLKDSAKAVINANTVSLNTKLMDNASLKLSGSTEDHIAALGAQTIMSTERFAATTSQVNSIASTTQKVVAAKKQTLETIALDELAK